MKPVWIALAAGALLSGPAWLVLGELVHRRVSQAVYRALGERRRERRLRHVVVFEPPPEPPKDDGRRLFSDIEDHLELYGIGSACRAEVHFHHGAST